MPQKLSENLDAMNLRIGNLVAYCCLALVVNVFVAVLQRYIFNSNYVWQSELSEVLSGAVFLLCAGYTMYYNSHVRVDIAYERFSSVKRAWVNLFGTLFLLLPMCIAIIYFSYGFILSSWKIWESSAEYSGIYGVFLFKTFIWGFSFFLIAGGISSAINSIKILKSS